MKFIEKHVRSEYGIRPEWGMGDHPLFLDIETTGLSAERSMIYLIGTARPEAGGLHFMQWLAEGPDDERAVIEAAFSAISPEDTIVTFNGETFDLPFIERRAGRLRLPYSFSENESFDLYKKLKVLKKLLGLSRCTQKSFEGFLGMPRDDKENGGDLIQVYWRYVRNHSDRLAYLFLLHNEEDVLNMAGVATLLSYRSLLYGSLTVTEILENDQSEGALQAAVRTDLSVPVPLDFKTAALRGRIAGDIITLSLPVTETSLFYYFSDYKNYYYIPERDMAIHKSVGEFVPKEQRVPAKKETARVRKDGLFIPCAGIAAGSRHLYRSAPGEEAFLSLSEIRPDDISFWESYLREDLPLMLAER